MPGTGLGVIDGLTQKVPRRSAKARGKSTSHRLHGRVGKLRLCVIQIRILVPPHPTLGSSGSPQELGFTARPAHSRASGPAPVCSHTSVYVAASGRRKAQGLGVPEGAQTPGPRQPRSCTAAPHLSPLLLKRRLERLCALSEVAQRVRGTGARGLAGAGRTACHWTRAESQGLIGEQTPLPCPGDKYVEQ